MVLLRAESGDDPAFNGKDDGYNNDSEEDRLCCHVDLLLLWVYYSPGMCCIFANHKNKFFYFSCA